MERAPRFAWLVNLAGVAATGIGLLVLVAYSVSEVVAHPGLSLAAGYWVGRLPWTAIGVDLTVFGASIVVASGAVMSWLAGGLLERIITTVALAIAAFWWILAVNPPRWALPCSYCPLEPVDPLARAYSEPTDVIVLLLAPALVVGVVSLLGRRSGRIARSTP